jgi:hypothetical protein
MDYFIFAYSRSSHNAAQVLYASEIMKNQPEWPLVCNFLDQMRPRIKQQLRDKGCDGQEGGDQDGRESPWISGHHNGGRIYHNEKRSGRGGSSYTNYG